MTTTGPIDDLADATLPIGNTVEICNAVGTFSDIYAPNYPYIDELYSVALLLDTNMFSVSTNSTLVSLDTDMFSVDPTKAICTGG